MREALAPLSGQRLAVTATVGRYGARHVYRNFHEQTLLLLNVRAADGATLCDHMWMPVGTRIAAAGLNPGETVAFTARVRPYQKYRIYRRRGRGVTRISSILDYTLGYPSRIAKAAATSPEGSAQP